MEKYKKSIILNSRTQKKIGIIWGLMSILLIALLIIFWDTYLSFFVFLNVINILLFIFVLFTKNRIESNIAALINNSKIINDKIAKTSMDVQYEHEKMLGILLLFPFINFCIYIIFVSVTDIDAYSLLVKEDGFVEYSSAILWFLSALILLLNINFRMRSSENSRIEIILYTVFIIFFILCAGEEISWGQRILGFETPDTFQKINIQKEFNFHNIGSISVFSNSFFILTSIFFLILPFIKKKYVSTKNYFNYHYLPTPNRFVVIIYVICIFTWLFIGIRFGTLGFHPFSFYPEKYYTQMDDEIFELFAAYSFFCFSITVLFRKTVKIRKKADHPDIQRTTSK